MVAPNWTRSELSREHWGHAALRLQRGELALLGLWAERRCAYMAVMEHDTKSFAVLSVACEEGCFPSVARVHPPAMRPERTIRDLVGVEPEGLPDARPWLRHAGAYGFLPATGESLHQIPVGPVHAGVIEPGHFRFTANGETVVRLEERLGYTHKGVDALIAGAPVERAAVLAGRVSGDSTVAFALAFARAVEAALAIELPPRAEWLRGLLAELERLANHFGDIGAICNDAALAILHAQFGLLRERVLRTCSACFGHRLMMDRVVPGGLSCDLPADGGQRVRELVALVRRIFPDLVEVYENTASLKDRTVGTGILSPALAHQFAAGGFVGRASGRNFDARRTPGYPPYDALRFEVPVVQAGDVNARVWIRIREVEQSLALIEQILAALPPGPVLTAITEAAGPGAREGVALVEGFRGDVFVWLRIDAEGRIERCHLRDPSWFQWPLLEAAIEGNIVADFPLCNKSFNCSYSGHDL
ncbi:MAG TPA: NADH-quinone oxidoreductase subunit C [Burkholderiales bacterium]|nr:NADH-quinone oxidoreductase subunit C [Burkholderiales bacterium]